MSTFNLYLQLGFEHIADLAAFDHILFIVTLCAVYEVREWKRVLVLITAFTLGHSLTLALATLGHIQYSTSLIEFLIPCTILATAIGNLFQKPGNSSPVLHIFKYLGALFFGLIHGLGFSSFLQGLLGQESNIVWPLFAFNTGIEIGQVLIVIVVMAISWVLSRFTRIERFHWIILISGISIGMSFMMLLG